MGCGRDIRDGVSNHIKSAADMDSRYNRHSYDQEAREWLQKWSDYLSQEAEGEVVQIRYKYILYTRLDAADDPSETREAAQQRDPKARIILVTRRKRA